MACSGCCIGVLVLKIDVLLNRDEHWLDFQLYNSWWDWLTGNGLTNLDAQPSLMFNGKFLKWEGKVKRRTITRCYKDRTDCEKLLEQLSKIDDRLNEREKDFDNQFPGSINNPFNNPYYFDSVSNLNFGFLRFKQRKSFILGKCNKSHPAKKHEDEFSFKHTTPFTWIPADRGDKNGTDKAWQDAIDNVADAAMKRFGPGGVFPRPKFKKCECEETTYSSGTGISAPEGSSTFTGLN